MDRLHPWFQCAQQPWCCHRSQRPRGLMCSHKPPASCNNFVEWRMFQWWDRMCKNCRFLLTVFRFHWSTKTQFTIPFFLFWKCLSNMLKINEAWKYDSQEYRIYIQVRSNKSNEKGCVCLYSANGKVWILIVKNNKKLTQKYFMICLYKYWNKSVERVKM